MEYEYIFPKKIKNNKNIYTFLGVFNDTYKNVKNSTIYINFQSTYWIDLNLIAPLGMILENIKSKNNKIYLRNLSKALINIFSLTDFRKYRDKNDIFYSNSNILPYVTLSGEETDVFQAYICEQLNKFINSDISKKIVIKRIMEIFINIKLHARNSSSNKYGKYEVFFSGFYKSDTKEIIFTIANQGLSFRESIERHVDVSMINSMFRTILKKDNNITDDDYISLALKKGFSTKEGNVPGGMGLFYLQEFINDIAGSLIVMSGKGYYETNYAQRKDAPYRPITKTLDSHFQGSIITAIMPLDNLSALYTPSISSKFIYSSRDFIEGGI